MDAKKRFHVDDEGLKAIVVALDLELEKTGRAFLTANEANAILARLSLLPDYAWHAGRALRELLKAGKIPHAYKVSGGKVGQWVIPHSAARRTLDKPQADYPKSPEQP